MPARTSAAALCATLLLGLPTPSAGHPVTRLFTTDDGLVRNWVMRIRQDGRGRLWLATAEGLSLFDGETFANYGTSQGLPNRLVTDILEAGDGWYWLATYGGLYRFRPRAVRAASFERVPLPGSTPGTPVKILYRTRSGEVWCGTASGLYRIRNGEHPVGEVVPLKAVANHFPDIVALEEDGGGSLWIGIETMPGMIRLRADGSSSFLRFSERGSPHGVQGLLLDREGFLWAGGPGGICRLDVHRDPPTFHVYSERLVRRLDPFRSFYQDAGGDVWIGGRGLAQFRSGGGFAESQVQLFNEDPVLGTNYISAIAGDLAGNLWAGVSNLGVMRILRSGFSFFTEADGLESKAVLAVFESHDGDLFAVSGYHHTLNRFDGERFTATQPYTPSSIWNFGWGEQEITLQDRRGEWWVATSNGLLRYPKVAKTSDLARTPPKRIYHPRDGLPNDMVLRLVEDREGGVWIGCTLGVARWDPATDRIEDLTSESAVALGKPPQPLSFAEDRQGQMWIGFFEGGLLRYHGGRFENVSLGLPAGSINHLLSDHSGRLWVGSSQGGLGRMDAPGESTPHIRIYATAQGLRSNQVFALAEDTAGRIYAAGGQGVDWLDTATQEIHHFAAGNGMPPGEVQRMYADRRGAIWFASNFGVSRYVPAAEPATMPQPPSIREIRVAGVPVLISDEGERHVGGLAFGAGKDSVEIGYGAVDFSVGNRVRYRYRLLPMETDWQQPSTWRSTHYAGIGPGSYRFEVQTVGPADLTGGETASVNFRIDWPFWKTLWFRLFAVAFAIGLGMAAHFYRVRHLLAVERVRTRLAADLHDDLGSGLAEIAILTEVARTEERPRNLEAVAQRARELRSTMSDIVWSVDPKCDNLEDLVRRFRQTAVAMLGDDRLEFLVSGGDAACVELTPDCRRNLLLMFKEIVTNIARHANAERVTVQVRHMSGRLHLEVRDDGRGFRPEEACSGNGLRTMSQRAEALGARLEIHSAPGNGSTVRVASPLS